MMPTWLVYWSAPSRGRLQMVHEAFCWLYQKMDKVEKLFLARFFEVDTEVSVLTLLTTKQKKGESIKVIVERFWSVVLRRLSGITQSMMTKSCRHNLQTTLLVQIRVTKSRTWKQLVLQGELVEESYKSKPGRLQEQARKITRAYRIESTRQ